MVRSASSSPRLDYRMWQHRHVTVGNRTFRVATKPGLVSHGHDDPSEEMLATALIDSSGHVVVSMACGSGLAGSVAAAHGAREVWLTDRNGLAVEAAQRTLAANAIDGPRVLLGHGASMVPEGVVADVVAVRVVPDRLPLLHLLHDACRVLRAGGRCYLAGGNHEGAKSAARALEQMFGNVRLVAQRGGHRLVVATRPASVPDAPADLLTSFVDPRVFHEVPVRLAGESFTMYTRPGVFSWQHVDEATAVLAGLLQVRTGERVLDIGCGAGALGVIAARQSRTGNVCLVDVDSDAVRCASLTTTAAGLAHARTLVSDVALAVIDERFDVVVANPPFHVGKTVDLDVPRQFIRDAHDVLAPGGRVLLVANRTLPYEALLSTQFGHMRMIHDGQRFKVLSATK